MTVDELIAKLSAQGVNTTPEQINELLGDISSLTDDDLPGVVEMLTNTPSDPTAAGKSKRGRSGKLSNPSRNPRKGTEITKIDANNLPEVASLTSTEVGEYIAVIEEMDAQGQSVSDELVAFLCDLYDRRNQFIELAMGAAERFKAQDTQLAQAVNALNATIGGSVSGLRDAQQAMQAMSGGARLGDNFRTNTQRWKSAADRFNAHVAAQSHPGTESAA